MPDTDAGAFAGHDLSEGGKVAAQGVGVLVVDGLCVHLAEVTATFRFDHKRLKWNIFDADFLFADSTIDRWCGGVRARRCG